MRQQQEQIHKTLRHPIRDLSFYICTQKRGKYFHPFLCTVWLGTNSGGSKRSLYDCGIAKGSREPVLVLVRRLWSDAPFYPDDWWSHPAIHKRIFLSLSLFHYCASWMNRSFFFSPLTGFPYSAILFPSRILLVQVVNIYTYIYIYIYLLFYFAGLIDQCRRQIMLRKKEIGERNRQVGQLSLSCTRYVFSISIKIALKMEWNDFANPARTGFP